VDQVATLVTDRPPPPHLGEALTRAGVDVIVSEFASSAASA
jgi:hypothetical protein